MDNPGEDSVDSGLMEELREGIERRRSQLAGQSRAEANAGPHELESTEFLEEPPALYTRPLIGGIIVGSRKVFRRLFLKWYTVPLLQQQNSFNRNVSLSFRDVVHRNQKLRQELDDLRRRVEELEQERD